MAKKDIDTIKIKDFIWLQFKSNRISFFFKGLPRNIHFTLAWNPFGGYNLHITKECNGPTNKPKVVVARFDRHFLDEFSLFAPALLFCKMLYIKSFKRYTRRQRKGVQVVFLDDLENREDAKPIIGRIKTSFDQHSRQKRSALIVEREALASLTALASETSFMSALVKSIRSLDSRTFQSACIRAGFIFEGGKSKLFLSQHGRCYVFREDLTLFDLFTAFTRSDFAEEIINYLQSSLQRLQEHNVQTYADIEAYDKCYHLYLEQPEKQRTGTI